MSTASVPYPARALNISRQHVGMALRAMRQSAQYDAEHARSIAVCDELF